MSFQNFQKAKSTTEEPPHSKDKSESQDESSEGEDSEEDKKREEEEEEEEDDDENDDEDEDDDDDEEEEDENDDDDDDNEEEEEDEEEGNESEDSNEDVASIPAHAASLEDVDKASVTGEKNPDIHISDNRDSQTCILSGDEIDSKTRAQQIAGAGYAIPVTFDVEHDYVVSAVRVESKFSDDDDDDDESLGKENKWSSEQNKVSNWSLIQKPSTFPASSEEEINQETEKDKGSPPNKSQISVDAMWMDSSDEVDCQKMGFGPNAGPAGQTEEYSVENNGSSDVKDDVGSHKWTPTSSQGSLLGQCSTGPPQHNKTSPEATNDYSDWDSSCKSNSQNVHLPFLKNEEGSVVMENNPGEQQCLLDCCDVASFIGIGRVSDEPSASVPPVPDEEDEPKRQIQDIRDVESCWGLSKKEIMDLGNDQDDGGNLDDEDNSCGSTVEGDVLKTPCVSGNSKLEVVADVEVDDGSSEDGEHPIADDITTFENCDSRRNCADNLLPQTDIDDVDLDSSDEAKSVVERRKEVRNPEGPINQVPLVVAEFQL